MTKDKLPITCYCSNKDGAKWLKMTLQAISFCDQIIFLDDNSTDESVEIAKAFTDEIYHWTGENSMSERRNYAIGFMGNDEHKPEYLKDKKLMKNIPEVRHEWILQLDSDEEFEASAERYLRDFLKSPVEKTMNTVSFDLLNLSEGKEGIMGAIPLPRMFRKGTIYWTKAIQNMVEFSLPVGSLAVDIRHYGYANPEFQWLKQWERLPLLEEDLRNHPKDFERRKYLINVLSVLCANRGDAWEQLYAQAAIAAKQFLGNKGLYRDHPSCVAMQKVMRFLWSSCARTGQIDPFIITLKGEQKEGKKSVWEYIKFHPDPWFWMFAIYRSVKNYDGVLECGEGFFKAHHYFEMNPQMVEITTYSKMYEVADCLQVTYEGLAKVVQEKPLKRKYAKRAGVWAKKKLEYWQMPEKEEVNG